MPSLAAKGQTARKFRGKRKSSKKAPNGKKLEVSAEETAIEEPEPAVVKCEPVDEEHGEGPKKGKKNSNKARVYAARKLKRQRARQRLTEQRSCIPTETIVLNGEDLAAQRERMAEVNARCIQIQAPESKINDSQYLFKDALSVRRRRMNVANLLVEYKSRKMARKKAYSLKGRFEILSHFTKKVKKEEDLVINPCKLNLESLSKRVTNDHLKRAFPKAKNIYYKDGESHGMLEYEDREDSEAAFRTPVIISGKNVVVLYKMMSGDCEKVKRVKRNRKAKFRVPPTKESDEENSEEEEELDENDSDKEEELDEEDFEKSPPKNKKRKSQKKQTENVNSEEGTDVQADSVNAGEDTNKKNKRKRTKKQAGNINAEESPVKKKKNK